MLIPGDILDPIVRVATDFIDSAGLAGVFVLMTLESACIPIPSEAIMLFAGFNVSQGHLTLIGIVVAGRGRERRRLADRLRRRLLGPDRAAGAKPVDPHQPGAARARRLVVARNGSAAVFFTRMLPIVRTFSSLPAGVARMPLGRFTALTLAGCVPWVLLLAIIGREVGDRWETWRNHLHYVDYAIVALVVAGIAYYLIRRRRGTDAWEPTPPD